MSYCGISHYCCSSEEEGVVSQSSDRRSSPILRRGVRRRQHSVYLMCHAGVRCEKKLGPHNWIRHIIAPMCSCTNTIFYTKYITSSFQIQLRYNPPNHLQVVPQYDHDDGSKITLWKKVAQIFFSYISCWIRKFQTFWAIYLFFPPTIITSAQTGQFTSSGTTCRWFGGISHPFNTSSEQLAWKVGKNWIIHWLRVYFFFRTDSTNSYIAPGCLKPSCKAEQYAISLSWLVILVNHS